jgi:hypothetical protein
MMGGMIALAAGCMETQDSGQTAPPYASISDEAREPVPIPTPASPDDSGGVMSAIGSALMVPVHLIFW